MNKQLRNHPNADEADYEYLSDKGYSNKEIKEIWDRDLDAGKGPVTVNTDKINFPGIVEFLNN